MGMVGEGERNFPKWGMKEVAGKRKKAKPISIISLKCVYMSLSLKLLSSSLSYNMKVLNQAFT